MKPTEFRKFSPSNATHGDCFMSEFCFKCVKYTDPDADNQCDVLLRAMIYNENEDEYPNQWTYDSSGNPTCTVFKDRDEFNAERRAKRKKATKPKCKNTLDLF